MTKDTSAIRAQWTTMTGLRAVVVHDSVLQLCGYVGVPVGHPLYGIDHRLIFLNVHGGTSHSGNSRSYPTVGDLHWFGFDTAHAFDEDAGGRSLGFVQRECEQFAEELVEIASMADIPWRDYNEVRWLEDTVDSWIVYQLHCLQQGRKLEQ